MTRVQRQAIRGEGPGGFPLLIHIIKFYILIFKDSTWNYDVMARHLVSDPYLLCNDLQWCNVIAPLLSMIAQTAEVTIICGYGNA